MVLYTNLASHRPRTWKVTQKPMPVSKQFPYGLAVRIPGFHTGGLGRLPLCETLLLFGSLHYIFNDLRIPLGDSRLAKLFSH